MVASVQLHVPAALYPITNKQAGWMRPRFGLVALEIGKISPH